jgi:large subunit ribosomal protein L3
MLNRNYRGLLGTKIGMTQVWDANNRVVPVTVIQAGPNVVTQIRTVERDGYSAVQLGYGEVDPRKVTKPLRGHFDQAGVTPRRHLVELRTADSNGYRVGQELTGEVFEAGAVVDVTGTSKGKGFAGVMKRHGFAGLGAGHGVERKHRSPGSVGGCATPGRVFKGLRMAGHMGHTRVTTPGLTVHGIDSERGYLLVRGAVPGPDGGLVLVRSAAKRPAPADAEPPADSAGATSAATTTSATEETSA